MNQHNGAGNGSVTAAPSRAAVVADAAVRLAECALAFGRVNRTACRHPDGTPESDSDHTVMLGWLAPALADLTAPHLYPELVAAFALVHDAVEAFAGDTPTLRITDQGRAGKAAREQAAARRWEEEFGHVLPWLPAMISRYEAQDCPEARWVRAVDKICPKLLHILSGATDLAGYGMTAEELRGMLTRQRADITEYAGEFRGLLALYDEMAARTTQALAACPGPGTCPTPPAALGTGRLAGIRAAQHQAWANKLAKGFNTTNVPLEFCLLAGEVAEAFDAWRKDPGSLGGELADAAIFLLGLAEMTGTDLAAEIARKLTVNEAQSYARLPNGTLVKQEGTHPS